MWFGFLVFSFIVFGVNFSGLGWGDFSFHLTFFRCFTEGEFRQLRLSTRVSSLEPTKVTTFDAIQRSGLGFIASLVIVFWGWGFFSFFTFCFLYFIFWFILYFEVIVLSSNFHINISEKRTFYSSGYTRNPDFRINVLKSLQKSIKEHQDNIIAALDSDFGKSSTETYLTEIVTVLSDIDFYIKNIKRLSKPKATKSSILTMPSKGKIYPNPYGVVLIISPWNYPFYLTMSPLIAAIAAGNCAVLKPSELSPNTSKIIYEIIDEMFEPNFISVELGDADVASSLLNCRFDYIFFTGSTRVGQIVLQKAAKYLTPVTLELGGKNPCIVDETADLEVAAKRIVWGKYINSGQTCVAPDYLFVHSSVRDKLVDCMKVEIGRSYGSNVFTNPDFARIINEKHFDRLLQVIGSGQVVLGGNYDRSKIKIEPTIIENVENGSIADIEEIFGPVLVLKEYGELSDVIEYVNSKEHPLALYIFSRNKKNIDKIITRCQFGGGAVNDTVMHIMSNSLPFGGVGNSGMGRYHGRFGFDTFTHYKGVLHKKSKIDMKQKFPPYDKKTFDFLNRILDKIL